jgi:hypothetical protein
MAIWENGVKLSSNFLEKVSGVLQQYNKMKSVALAAFATLASAFWVASPYP